jgi:hypothetical protein
MPQQEMKSSTNAGHVKLFTRSGEYVTTVTVPPFNPPAEVIVWGQRFFVLTSGTYREGLPYYSNEAPR